MKRIFYIALGVCIGYAAQAQNRQDTSRRTVVITSAYKPTVKPASKINFSASIPGADSTRPTLQYEVPSQNLFFSYQPASLKPLALAIDTSFGWINNNYIKLGYGNYSTPFAQAGFSFGDGKSSVINVHTKHIAQKGSLPFQQYSRSSAEVIGIFNNQDINEMRGKLNFEQNSQYFYGYKPNTLQFTKDNLRQRFTSLGGMVGLRNKTVNQYGISYDPTVSLNFFGDNRSGKETSIVLNAPVSKTFGRAFGFNLGFTADVTNFKRGNGSTIKNNLYYLTPAVLFKTPNFNVVAGFTPSWDNQVFTLLPNFTATVKLREEQFVLQGGWIGYYQKNTFQSLSNSNPWIQQPGLLLNTRIKEQYIGFKGSAGSHLTYNARVSNMNYSNPALFVNDSLDGKTFVTLYEPMMKGLRLHGEIGYTQQEKFSLLAGATINQYTGLDINEKAWGLLPLELTGALRWQILKDLQFKSDIFFWDGAQYRDEFYKSRKLKPAIDLNAGVEFSVTPKLNIWMQFNNVFNNKYERWNRYEVLGFNVQGGIVYSFSNAASSLR